MATSGGPSARVDGEIEELFDLSRDLLCIAGFDGLLKRVNEAFVRSLGYPRQELLTRPFLEFVHPDDVQGSIDAMAALASGTDLIGYEHRMVCADGSVIWVQWTTRTMPQRGYMFAAARDVTDRRRAEDEQRALAEEQAALRRVATLVARHAPPVEVFAAVAEEAGRVLGVEGIRIVRFEDDESISVVASWGEPDSAMTIGTRMPLGGVNIARIVHDTNQAARIDDSTSASGSLGAAVRSEGLRTAVGTPIVVGGRLWGVTIAAASRPEPLRANIEVQLGALTDLVATAISNAQARADLAGSRARLVAAADEERRRVVRDLHDGAQQRIVHAVIQLKLASASADPMPHLAEGLEHAERAMVELRELAHGILPAVLTQGGLPAVAEALAERSPVPVELDVAIGRLPAPLEATAYFVVAEALTNVAKHAQASAARVSARIEDGALHVRVRDDGTGGAHPDGSGLVGLADRLAAIGGRLVVESPVGGGTTVAAVVPIPA